MTPEALSGLRELLETQRVLCVSVVIDGIPEAGLLPYVLSEDFGAVYVQASGLARHTRGLEGGSLVSVLIHAGDAPDRDPLQLHRLTVHATVRRLEKGSGLFASAAARFVARFAAAAITLGLDDFNLYELDLGAGRYVEGFGRAFQVGPHTFASL